MPRRSALVPAAVLVLIATALVVGVDAQRGAARPAAQLSVRAPVARDTDHVEGRVLVGFASGTSRSERNRTLDDAGADTLDTLGRVTVAEVPESADEQAVADELAADPDVAFAEPDFLRRPHACGDCWFLDPRPGVDAAAVHAAGQTGSGSTVAVLDSGVNIVPDLNGQVLSRRWCQSTTPCAVNSAFVGGHGTMVASLIAARSDLTGITGVAPGAKLKSWRVTSDAGSIPTSAVVAALTEVAADPDVDVVNMSFGGSSPSSAEQLAVKSVLDKGKSVVASAGNDGGYWPQYPAAYAGVLSVGATDADGAVAPFSSYGKVDVVAPGVCVPTSAPPGSQSSAGCAASPRNNVVYVSGTSFSAPMVTGLLALHRSTTAGRTRLGIQATADETPPDGLGDRKRWGHGLADALAWHQSFTPGAPPYLVLEPSIQLLNPASASATSWFGYALTSTGTLPVPTVATFSGLTAGTAPFGLIQTSLYRAGLSSGKQTDDGTHSETVSALVGTASRTDTAFVRVLRSDDQAPGQALTGAGPWHFDDSIQGGGTGNTESDDHDDVRAVHLDEGDQLTVDLDGPGGKSVFLSLYSPATTDVMTQLEMIDDPADTDRPGIMVNGSAPNQSGDSTLTFEAVKSGTYLLDVYALGQTSGVAAKGSYSIDIQAA